jgi:Ca-activated chloride channel family protein
MTTNKPEIKYLEPTIAIEKEEEPKDMGGLIALAEGKEQALPLKSVKVRADMIGDCCRTVIEQHFGNELNKVMEAIHIFPLPEDGAVVEMELEAGDVVVKAECRQREEAEKVYKEAREAGYQAGLLTQERADVHTLRVTNLPPKSDVLVRIVVVERLETIDGHWRWRFPTVIAPRYLPGTPIGHEGPGVLPDSDHVPDASHLQPPLRLEGGTTLDLEVRINGHVREIGSSLHAVRLDLGENGLEGIRIAPSGRATLDRDFVLAFSSADERDTGAHAYTDGTHTLVFVEPPSIEIPEALPRDAVFVIDRSGSMRGPKMEAAKLALKSALHGLQAGDRFMLISFSNDMQSYTKGFTEYTQNALEKADRWIDKIQAGGGTEMLPAIKEALSEDRLEGRSYTVLLITDGQVWNEAELVAAVANRREEARFFTMGIGTAVSSSLLKRLARVGGGTCELLTPSEDIEAAVARMEARFGSPIAEDVILEGGLPADEHPKSLFIGRPASWLLKGAPKSVRVVGVTSEGGLELEAEPMMIEFPLGALWARERVSVLEDQITLQPSQAEAIRPEIIQIALQHQIASRFTAFVAVEKTRKVTGERIEVVQPVELPMDWDQTFLGMPRLDQMKGMALRSVDQFATAAPRPMADMVMMAASEAPEKLGRLRRKSKREDKKVIPSKVMGESLDGQLARMQNADGSFGGDVKRTVAALMALILLGHTRRKGIRRRTVLKMAKWLEAHFEDPWAVLALDALKRSERGESIQDFIRQRSDEIADISSIGEEGNVLREILRKKQIIEKKIENKNDS